MNRFVYSDAGFLNHSNRTLKGHVLRKVGGWVKPLNDKRGKVGTIKSPKNLG